MRKAAANAHTSNEATRPRHGEPAEPLRLDPGNACVWRGDTALTMTPKAFAVLRYLVEHPRRLIGKRGLLDAVWPDTYVGDAVLKVAVLEVRKALGDRHRSPRFIETVHRNGYRFLGGIVLKPAPEEHAEAERSAARAMPATEPIAPPLPKAPAAPLVGRRAELARLSTALSSAVAGERRVVFVTGEAGIGKSALVDAFVAEPVGAEAALVARAQCREAHGRGEAYLPVLEALGRLCRGPARDLVVDVLRRRAPSWLVQLPWLVAGDEREALLRDLRLAPRERMLREMAEAVDALASSATVVLVLEDLQWSDASTLDLLASLAARRDGARLLVVGTFRPADVPPEESTVQALAHGLELRRAGEELRLAPLDEGDVAAFLEQRFAPAAPPAELSACLHRRSGGNPLFLGELVDHLLAAEMLAHEDDRVALRGAAEDVTRAVPAALRAMIDKRVERLPADERGLLEAASAAGVEFASAIVATALEVEPIAIEERCERLARRGDFLVRTGVVELADGGVAARYRFRHTLFRDVLEERLTPGLRLRLRRRMRDGDERRAAVSWTRGAPPAPCPRRGRGARVCPSPARRARRRALTTRGGRALRRSAG
jgi:DNA-binding winged helix-turn-helix (wHTH) protein